MFSYENWYAQNKTARNAARRRRYARDSRFRADCIARSRWHRNRNRTGREDAGVWTRKLALASRKSTRHLRWKDNGCGGLMVGINEVAARTGLMQQTLTRWESVGLIAPIQRDAMGHRWFPTVYAEMLVKLVEQGRREMWSTVKLSRELAEKTGR